MPQVLGKTKRLAVTIMSGKNDGSQNFLPGGGRRITALSNPGLLMTGRGGIGRPVRGKALTGLFTMFFVVDRRKSPTRKERTLHSQRERKDSLLSGARRKKKKIHNTRNHVSDIVKSEPSGTGREIERFKANRGMWRRKRCVSGRKGQPFQKKGSDDAKHPTEVVYAKRGGVIK